ncbi:AraC-like DNA-binding protein [Rhizobium sp. PP-F2F-G48]|uniref:AraC family transcriptional regulator n=1 Tax=Rhizobium sp. PP-F2F-G48 TaxID=2135651 RepID=UPI001053E092|nr:helix-turn-helix domain-containing protein [Rhizobium sp. PP-F2F-G48]TCM44836.1 AraC-like DNA-binding protein [Rhizobium sp. PP-F2F-G48]
MPQMEFFDVDQANNAIKSLAAPFNLEPPDKGKFHVLGRVAQTDSLLIFGAASITGYHARYTKTLDDFVFAIHRKTLDLDHTSQIDGENVHATVMIDRRDSEGSTGLAMMSKKGVIIEACTLMKAVCDRMGQSHAARITFAPGGMALPVHIACEHICDTLYVGLSEHGGLAGNPLAIANLQDALINTILYGAQHNHTAALLQGSIELPRIIRTAMQYMDANVHLPITPTDVAVASGVSIRSLQLTFRERLETTPQQYLRRIRLKRAYADLKAGNGLGVGEIARKWGFYSSGEFARLFFAEFGERPGDVFRQGSWR